jgi:hypothetical protein
MPGTVKNHLSCPGQTREEVGQSVPFGLSGI